VARAEGTVYVYGVLPAAEQGALSAAGVEGAEVRAVEHAGLVALTSHVRGGALAAGREVRAHWRVLEEASAGATVLPVRFGTVMESEDAVRELLLEPNAERLAMLLEELAGRVQLSVKGDYKGERMLREVVSTSPAVAELRRRIRALPDAAGYYERIRLGEVVAREVARRREEDTRLALARLEPHAAAAHEEHPANPHAAFDLAFLVERDAQAQFGAAVGSLAEELGERIDIRYIGPLPPYSFADVDLSHGNAAWA
jgi:hypothetical protein